MDSMQMIVRIKLTKDYSYSVLSILLLKEESDGSVSYYGGIQKNMRDIWLMNKLNPGKYYAFVNFIFINTKDSM